MIQLATSFSNEAFWLPSSSLAWDEQMAAARSCGYFRRAGRGKALVLICATSSYETFRIRDTQLRELSNLELEVLIVDRSGLTVDEKDRTAWVVACAEAARPPSDDTLYTVGRIRNIDAITERPMLLEFLDAVGHGVEHLSIRHGSIGFDIARDGSWFAHRQKIFEFLAANRTSVRSPISAGCEISIDLGIDAIAGVQRVELDSELLGAIADCDISLELTVYSVDAPSE